MSEKGRIRPRNDAELEQIARIQRTEPPRLSQETIRRLERKILGRSWGRPRKKMEGWPK